MIHLTWVLGLAAIGGGVAWWATRRDVMTAR